MNTNLLGYVLGKLDERSIPWTRVSRETSIPYETLKKIAHRRTPNPGVKHVQVLADYFSRPPPGGELQEPVTEEQGVV